MAFASQRRPHTLCPVGSQGSEIKLLLHYVFYFLEINFDIVLISVRPVILIP
jgi:hypothetical protein